MTEPQIRTQSIPHEVEQEITEARSLVHQRFELARHFAAALLSNTEVTSYTTEDSNTYEEITDRALLLAECMVARYASDLVKVRMDILTARGLVDRV